MSAPLWTLWRSLWISASLAFDAIQRKSLRDNSKAPLTRSTPKPELRAEREALSLLHFLRAQDQPQSEWLNAISSDQTLSAPVRQRALQFAREWKSLWSAVCQHRFGSLAQPLDVCIARIRRHPKKVAPRQIQSSADTEHSKVRMARRALGGPDPQRTRPPTRPAIRSRMEVVFLNANTLG